MPVVALQLVLLVIRDIDSAEFARFNFKMDFKLGNNLPPRGHSDIPKLRLTGLDKCYILLTVLQGHLKHFPISHDGHLAISG